MQRKYIICSKLAVLFISLADAWYVCVCSPSVGL